MFKKTINLLFVPCAYYEMKLLKDTELNFDEYRIYYCNILKKWIKNEATINEYINKLYLGNEYYLKFQTRLFENDIPKEMVRTFYTYINKNLKAERKQYNKRCVALKNLFPINNKSMYQEYNVCSFCAFSKSYVNGNMEIEWELLKFILADNINLDYFEAHTTSYKKVFNYIIDLNNHISKIDGKNLFIVPIFRLLYENIEENISIFYDKKDNLESISTLIYDSFTKGGFLDNLEDRNLFYLTEDIVLKHIKIIESIVCDLFDELELDKKNNNIMPVSRCKELLIDLSAYKEVIEYVDITAATNFEDVFTEKINDIDNIGQDKSREVELNDRMLPIYIEEIDKYYPPDYNNFLEAPFLELAVINDNPSNYLATEPLDYDEILYNEELRKIEKSNPVHGLSLKSIADCRSVGTYRYTKVCDNNINSYFFINYKFLSILVKNKDKNKKIHFNNNLYTIKCDFKNTLKKICSNYIDNSENLCLPAKIPAVNFLLDNKLKGYVYLHEKHKNYDSNRYEAFEIPNTAIPISFKNNFIVPSKYENYIVQTKIRYNELIRRSVILTNDNVLELEKNILSDRYLAIEAVYDENDIDYFLIYNKVKINGKRFIIYKLSTDAGFKDDIVYNILSSLISRKKIPKICYNSYRFYAILKRYGFQFNNIFSIQSTLSLISNYKMPFLRHREFFKKIYGDDFFTGAHVMFDCMFKYASIRIYLLQQIRKSCMEVQYDRMYYYDMVLGTSYLPHTYFEVDSDRYLYELVGHNKYDFKPLINVVNKLEGVIFLYNVNPNLAPEAAYTLNNVFIYMAYKGFFRKNAIQIMEISLYKAKFFIASKDAAERFETCFNYELFYRLSFHKNSLFNTEKPLFTCNKWEV